MMEKPTKFRPALIAGLIMGALSATPGLNLINCCCCAGIIIGGVLAAYLHQKEFTPEMPAMESSDAVIVGLLSGIVAAFTVTLVSYLILLSFGPVEQEMMKRLIQKMIKRVEEMGSVPSGSFDQLMEELDKSIAQSKNVSSALSGLFFGLIVYPLFAMLGAIIGFRVFRRSSQPNPQLPIQH